MPVSSCSPAHLDRATLGRRLIRPHLSRRVAFIEALVSFVPDLDLVPRNKWDDTPWHMAAGSGALDVLACISNVMSSALLLQGYRSRLPIHEAALHGHVDCVKALLAKFEATIDAESFLRATPLALAACKGHFAVVEYLAENGADVDATDEEGITCVAEALRSWNTRAAKYLLERGVNCLTVETNGNTLLPFAAATGDLDLVRQLLDNGFDPLARGYLGKTSLMRAVEVGWPEIIEFLLSRNPEASQILDNRGRTCLHVACLHASPPRILQTLLDHDSKLLLAVDNFRFDAMDYAVMEGRSDLVDVLFANGMPLDGSPESLWRPIDLAGSNGSIAVLNDLIKRGVSVNDQGSMADIGDGLNQACGAARVASARLLFQIGADPTLRDCLGLCALDYASKHHVLGEIFTSHERIYGGVDRKDQLAVLRETIIKLSLRLVSAKTSSDSKLLTFNDDMGILNQALLLFQTDTSVRGHVRIQKPSLESVVEENGQYIDSEGVLNQRFYEDIAGYYSDLRLEEITDFTELESVPVSKSEIAEDYEKVRNGVGPDCAKFMTCFMSQDSARKDLDGAFKEIRSKARPLLQRLENSDGNDVSLEDVKMKLRAYEIAWKTAQAIFHVPFEGSLQEAERNRRKAVSDGFDGEHDEKDKAIVEELETMKSLKRTLTAESVDNYDTASEASGRESWRSVGECLEHDQVSERSRDDEEVVWETCSES
ncbi:hypothetical protein CSOJ01_15727 [Colletotrichum sojae]|uniref:Ankyrin repeat protein n=1 Tax=Colletotrichum sojae TaxID=2175907 RepID=A0A8H6MGY2_9PEZI|nr:hypothetical protein CSOJ01_15727 [Colletotrichum sojae]